MKCIKIFLSALLVGGLLSACERDFESEGLVKGVIRYPSISLNEGVSVLLVAGEEQYAERGAVALLGEDDISNQLQISGTENIDASTPGVYPVTYSVTITNELGEPSTVSQTRYVIVTSEDISNIDLSGNYLGSGFTANPGAVTVTKLGGGWYSIPDVLASTNGISANFAHLGGDVILIPSQQSPWGSEINSTDNGAFATLTENGFTWAVDLDCCGLFGPIDFVKQ